MPICCRFSTDLNQVVSAHLGGFMTIHTFQLHDLEIAAFTDLLLDAVSTTQWDIKELRQSFDTSDESALLSQLSSIQFKQGRLEVYKELLDQIQNPY